MEKETKFEDNLKELEKIINELETGEIDLDSSIDKYTKAMKLVSTCEKKLNEVEEKVNKILNENGELKDFSIEENA
jgi:exodeoxyribonuclease VII small subunit